ncbi:MAG: aminotransferase class V-fold PLP-dependent enzyme [Planctomycetota bacterium]|jgi:selenocysteine lyase/cysteine desulfurase
MTTRRQFLGALGLPAAGLVAAPGLESRSLHDLIAKLAATPGTAGELAKDEDFWLQIAAAYTVDRSIINFNNGGVSPAPAWAQDAMKRNLDFSNECPAKNLWQILEPKKEGVRQRLAKEWACDPEELAITRNASEGMQILQFGFDLEPGDEVIATTQDYGRMVNTFKQRVKREGIVFNQFDIPVPAEDPAEIIDIYRKNITDKTKIIMVCHVINLTGQVLPIKEITALGRERGIPVIVDGAHAFANIDFTFEDIDVDYYATSLHKWLCAPHGTGLLYVRRDKIAGVWPLTAANDNQTADIRKFEEIGTHPAANHLAIAESLSLHQGIGGARKQARFNYLRDRWARRLMQHDRIRLHTSLKPGMANSLGNVQIEGMEPGELTSHLWKEHKIVVTPIRHAQFQGIRVSPGIYSTLSEVDRFCDAMEAAASA